MHWQRSSLSGINAPSLFYPSSSLLSILPLVTLLLDPIRHFLLCRSIPRTLGRHFSLSPSFYVSTATCGSLFASCWPPSANTGLFLSNLISFKLLFLLYPSIHHPSIPYGGALSAFTVPLYLSLSHGFSLTFPCWAQLILTERLNAYISTLKLSLLMSPVSVLWTEQTSHKE